MVVENEKKEGRRKETHVHNELRTPSFPASPSSPSPAVVLFLLDVYIYLFPNCVYESVCIIMATPPRTHFDLPPSAANTAGSSPSCGFGPAAIVARKT